VFAALDSDEQAAIVAHYQLHHRIEYLQQLEQQRKAKQAQRKK
jgi:hypothetical protein